MMWYLTRTREERRERYAHLRIFFDHKVAYRVRDWRPNKIRMFIENYAYQLKGGIENICKV